MLRAQWKPDVIELLLIGESVPDTGDGELRFFYAPTLSSKDYLFRGVVEALYGARALAQGTSKLPWLERLQRDGVFLLDLVPFPVNKFRRGERALARASHAQACLAAVHSLQPRGIVVCHTEVFRIIAPLLEGDGMPLLHSRPLPFPWGNHRNRFVEGVRLALGGDQE